MTEDETPTQPRGRMPLLLLTAFAAVILIGLWLAMRKPADLVQVVDTLGAGDAFISSVLVGLLAGRDKRAVLASASAHAAQVCLAPGAFGHGTPFRPATDAGTPARHDKTEVNR